MINIHPRIIDLALIVLSIQSAKAITSILRLIVEKIVP